MLVPFGCCPILRRDQIWSTMLPPSSGEYTVDVRPLCSVQGTGLRDKWQEAAPRRRDVHPPKWGLNTSIPVISTMPGGDNTEGLAQLDARPLQDIATEQGIIKMPYGPVADVSYMPTSLQLKSLPYVDSRRTAISDRYYR